MNTTSTVKPTARNVVIGAELRRARLDSGLRCTDVAARFGWSLSKVSRMETGARGIQTLDLVRFAAVCDMPALRLEHLLALASDTRTRLWLETGTHARHTTRTLEEHSSAITFYAPSTIPALARTTAYNQALAGLTSPEHWDGQDLPARRKALNRGLESKRVRFLIHEHALLTVVGDHNLMADQLEALQILARRDHITVVVVPASTAVPLGHTGPLTLLTDHHNHDTVLLHNLTHTAVLDDPDHTHAYRSTLDALAHPRRAPAHHTTEHLTGIYRHHARRRAAGTGQQPPQPDHGQQDSATAPPP